MRCIALVILVASLVLAAPVVPAETTTVLVVRHAEKVTEKSADPELTDEGRAHAAELAAELAHVELAAIYSTPFKRTRDTVAPTAKAKGVDVTVVEVGPDFTTKLARRILEENRGRSVLVVGHSNTIGPTLEALGCGPSFELDESVYGDLFVCTIPEGSKASWIRLKAWTAE